MGLNKNVRGFIILVLAAVIFLSIGEFIHFSPEAVQKHFQEFPPVFSGTIFVFVYVVLTFFIWLGPKDILRIAAAYLYGAAVSTVLITIAEIINAVILFSLSRKLGRGFVESRLKGKTRDFEGKISRLGPGTLFALRFFPIVPLRFLDLGFGLTRISFIKYLMICLLATPVRVFFQQFFLALGLDVVTDPQKLNAYLVGHPQVWAWTFMYLLGCVAMIIVWNVKGRHRPGAVDDNESS